jgi:hypothetical protein
MQYAAEFDYAPGRIDQQADAVLPDADLILIVA